MLLTAPTARAADSQPPNFMTYQGYLVDANGDPLAPNNPANYPVVFRIYDGATGGTRLWSEEQIVTIDNGNFSVLLGEGNQHAAETRPPLSTVFTMNGNGSDRFLGITVTLSGTPTEILPRLRLLPAPYAFLSRYANTLVDNNGAPLVSAGTGSQLVVGGRVSANDFAGDGAALTGLDAGNVSAGVLADARIPNLNASKVNAGIFSVDRIPNLDANKIASGTLATDRIPNLNANILTAGTLDDGRLSGNVARRNVGNTFDGNNVFNSAVGIRTAPSYALHVRNNDSFRVVGVESSHGTGTWLQLFNTGSGGREWSLISSGSGNGEGSGKLLFYNNTSGRVMETRTDGLAVYGALWVTSMPFGDHRNVQWNDSTGRIGYDNSSRRFKNNISPLKDDFSLLLQIDAKTYTRPDNPDRWEIGYIAEEFHDLGLRKLVDYDREGRPDGINYEKICLYLNENAKQQQRELTDLKARHEAQSQVIASQRRELDDLRTRLDQLERLLRTAAAPSAPAEDAGANASATTAPASLSQLAR